jgi:ribosomal protein L11 methyltransferase
VRARAPRRVAAGARVPRFPFVVVDVDEKRAEEAGARLLALGAQGIEQRDATTFEKALPGRVTLVASFGRKPQALRALHALPRLWSARIGEVVGDGWRDEWKKHFEPFHLTERIVVRPPWRVYARRAGEHVIVLEPGRAFGTGLHETTRLVAQTLCERASDVAGRTVLDIGCGSGVLGLVALVLGAERVRALDTDVEAVAVTRENARRNKQARRLVADSTPADRIAQRFDVIVANIDASTLESLAPVIAARAKPHALLVLSGVLGPEVDASQWDRVQRAFAPAPTTVVEVKRDGEWLAAVLRA